MQSTRLRFRSSPGLLVMRAVWSTLLCTLAMACTPLKDDIATDAGIEDGSDVGTQSADDAQSDIDAEDDAQTKASWALLFNSANYATALGGTQLRGLDVTIEVWANCATGGGILQDLVTRPYQKATDDSFALWFQSASLYGGVNPAGPNDAVSVAEPGIASHWVHLAFTFNHLTGDERLIVDCVVQSTLNRPTSIAYDDSSIFVGADQDYAAVDGFLSGALDEIRIWSIARTPAEIASTMHTRLAGTEPGLEAYWPFDEGSGQSTRDATGHGHLLQLGETASADIRDPLWVRSTAPITQSP